VKAARITDLQTGRDVAATWQVEESQSARQCQMLIKDSCWQWQLVGSGFFSHQRRGNLQFAHDGNNVNAQFVVILVQMLARINLRSTVVVHAEIQQESMKSRRVCHSAKLWHSLNKIKLQREGHLSCTAAQ
jgi:hypothetical protein